MIDTKIALAELITANLVRKSNLKPLFITATGTGVGKTYTTVLLLQRLTELGYKVAPIKPIETGVEHLPVDGLMLYQTAQENGMDLDLDTVCPVQFRLPAAPDSARKGQKIDWDLIDSAFEKCKQSSDIVLIEGAGGAFTPIENDIFNIDFAKRFGAETLLISHDRLGMIHDIITTTLAMKLNEIEPIVAINVRSDMFYEVAHPYLQKRFGDVMTIQSDLDKIIEKIVD